MHNEVIMIKNANIKVVVKDFFGNPTEYTAIWARLIKDNIYEVSLKNNDGGFTMFIASIDDKGIISIECSLYFNHTDYQKLSLAEKLNLNTKELKDKIFIERMNK